VENFCDMLIQFFQIRLSLKNEMLINIRVECYNLQVNERIYEKQGIGIGHLGFAGCVALDL